MSSLHDFTATTLAGEEKALADYAGQVVLVVNTASKCGFTPQFTELEELNQRFGEQGLVVLGFPCNQFAGQEPGDADAISEVCHLNYGVTFPMFDKIEVNGSGAHPLYKWLRSEKSGLLGSAIKWNFAKFLVGRDGQVIERYAPTVQPSDLATDIEAALAHEVPDLTLSTHVEPSEDPRSYDDFEAEFPVPPPGINPDRPAP